MGSETTSLMRSVPGSMLASAPRFHTGIGPHERAAVLEKSEGVFTAGQMDAIGDMNHNYTQMERAVGSINSVPTAIAQSLARSTATPESTTGAGVSPKAGNVTINMNNQSGQDVTAFTGKPRMDNEKMIVDVIIKRAQQPGQLRSVLRANA